MHRIEDFVSEAGFSEFCEKYGRLSGIPLFSTYLSDNGLTREEIEGLIAWAGSDLGPIKPDIHEYMQLQEQAIVMKAYRKVSAEEVAEYFVDDELQARFPSPWAWPTAMAFYPCKAPAPQAQGCEYGCSMYCYYNGKYYYFGVGKEEVEITEDMSENGMWFIYTYSD